MGFKAAPPLAQPLLVRGQFHQAQVAPDLALGQPVGGQMLAALRLDAVQRGAAQGTRRVMDSNISAYMPS